MTPKEALIEVLSQWIADDCGISSNELENYISPALKERGFVIVPIEPTPEMLKAAWADALAEDAGGVWREMIEIASRCE